MIRKDAEVGWKNKHLHRNQTWSICMSHHDLTSMKKILEMLVVYIQVFRCTKSWEQSAKFLVPTDCYWYVGKLGSASHYHFDMCIYVHLISIQIDNGLRPHQLTDCNYKCQMCEVGTFQCQKRFLCIAATDSHRCKRVAHIFTGFGTRNHKLSKYIRRCQWILYSFQSGSNIHLIVVHVCACSISWISVVRQLPLRNARIEQLKYQRCVR